MNNNPQNKTPTKIKDFNPYTHIPPSYDIKGFLKITPYIDKPENNRYNLLYKKSNKKYPWLNDIQKGYLSERINHPSTRSELLLLRKNNNLPDISYDLDGDNYVGNKDYVLSKRFDIDKDGRLNETEKNNALNAIKNGVENEYMWNLENIGIRNKYRILQKRGKIIENDDFLTLQDTYPKHPLSLVKSRNGIKTFRELKQYRDNKTIQEINQKMKKWEEIHPPKIVLESYNEKNRNKNNSFNYDNRHLNSSMKQINSALHKKARIKAGLSPCESDINITKNIPSLNYIYSPKHKVYNDLKKELKKESFEISKVLLNRKHLNEIERLNMREDEIFNKLFFQKEGLTYNKIKNRERKKILEYNIKTFSDHPKGVHGYELPKFSESKNIKEYWKHKEGYVEKPKYQSQVEYLENMKFWKKPEELLISEHKAYNNDYDFDSNGKIIFLKDKKKNEIIVDINKVNFYKNFDPNYVKPIDFNSIMKHKNKWSEIIGKFMKDKKNEKEKEIVEKKFKSRNSINKVISSSKSDININENNISKYSKNFMKTIEEFKKPLLQKFISRDQIILGPLVKLRTKGF